jgi:hypothetical protein
VHVCIGTSMTCHEGGRTCQAKAKAHAEAKAQVKRDITALNQANKITEQKAQDFIGAKPNP